MIQARRETSAALGVIQQMIAEVERQMAELEEARRDVMTKRGDGEVASVDATRLDEMAVFALRLHQIYDWLKENELMKRAVDTYLSDYYSRVERRGQRRDYGLAITTTVIGTLLGWLLSAFLPSSPLHLIGH